MVGVRYRRGVNVDVESRGNAALDGLAARLARASG